MSKRAKKQQFIFEYVHLNFCFRFFCYSILAHFWISLSICFGTLHFVYYKQSILFTVIVIPL